MAEVSQPGGSGKSGKTRRRKSAIRIDMTPMVDLAFLLLTFFMLTTHFLNPYVLPLEMPAKEEPGITPPPIRREKVLTVLLGEKNRVYWYQGAESPQVAVTTFDSNGIRKVLLEKNQQINGMYVLIKPTDKSRYQNVIDILDEIGITEIKRFAITKVTEEDLGLMAMAKRD
jgi:biopolymer transport protein ExbD